MPTEQPEESNELLNIREILPAEVVKKLKIAVQALNGPQGSATAIPDLDNLLPSDLQSTFSVFREEADGMVYSGKVTLLGAGLVLLRLEIEDSSEGKGDNNTQMNTAKLGPKQPQLEKFSFHFSLEKERFEGVFVMQDSKTQQSNLLVLPDPKLLDPTTPIGKLALSTPSSKQGSFGTFAQLAEVREDYGQDIAVMKLLDNGRIVVFFKPGRSFAG